MYRRKLISSATLLSILIGGIPAIGQTIYSDIAGGANGNTVRASDGDPDAWWVAATLPDSLWGLRTGYANNDNGQVGMGDGDVFEASGVGSGVEDCVPIKTTISGLIPGAAYDVSVVYWSATGQNWAIRAGFSLDNLLYYDYLGADGATAGTATGVTEGDRAELLGYLGQAVADSNGQIQIYVDDKPAVGPDEGWYDRTWYDGVEVTFVSILGLIYPVDVENIDYLPKLEWAAPAAFDPAAYYVYLDPNIARVEAAGEGQTPSTLEVFVTESDPNHTLTSASFTPPQVELQHGMRYYWKVEAYNATEPNYYSSNIATFTTIPDEPQITQHPQSTTVPKGSDAVFTIATFNVAEYHWFKVQAGSDIEVGEPNIPTLTINDVQKAKEGYYYCKVSNAATPEGIDSDAARLMVQRRVAWWNFDDQNYHSDIEHPADPNEDYFTGTYFDPNDTTPDPEFANANPSPAGGYYMVFSGDTPESDDDNHGETVLVEPNEFFNFYPQGFTASAWVNITGRTDRWTGYLSKHDRLVTQSYPIGWTMLKNPANNAVVAARGTTSTWADTVGTSDITLVNEDTGNTWHLLTGTYDGSVSRIYVDGNLETTSASSTYVMPENSMPLAIGAETSDGYGPLDGYIDNVEIYNYALSRLDIALMYIDQVPGAEVCVYDMVVDDMDFNDDCIVDMKDLAEFASDWLDCGIVPTCVQ